MGIYVGPIVCAYEDSDQDRIKLQRYGIESGLLLMSVFNLQRYA